MALQSVDCLTVVCFVWSLPLVPDHELLQPLGFLGARDVFVMRMRWVMVDPWRALGGGRSPERAYHVIRGSGLWAGLMGWGLGGTGDWRSHVAQWCNQSCPNSEAQVKTLDTEALIGEHTNVLKWWWALIPQRKGAEAPCFLPDLTSPCVCLHLAGTPHLNPLQ